MLLSFATRDQRNFNQLLLHGKPTTVQEKQGDRKTTGAFYTRPNTTIFVGHSRRPQPTHRISLDGETNFLQLVQLHPDTKKDTDLGIFIRESLWKELRMHLEASEQVPSPTIKFFFTHFGKRNEVSVLKVPVGTDNSATTIIHQKKKDESAQNTASSSSNSKIAAILATASADQNKRFTQDKYITETKAITIFPEHVRALLEDAYLAAL